MRRTASATAAGVPASSGEGVDDSPSPVIDSGVENVSGPPQQETPDPFEAAQQAVRSTVNNVFETVFRPLRAACPLLSSSWIPLHGNYILHPTTKPKSVIHFLGGAFFGAVPHILYNSLLTRLAARGHVIVATPYDLSFDYLVVADGIVRAWESIEGDLAARYGPLPVIGIGHSAGAVFHALAAALFDDAAPKAANVLISFNCRSAAEAIPNYTQLVAPIARAAVAAERALPDEFRTRLNNLPTYFDRLVEESILTPAAFRNEVLPTAKQSRRFVDQISPLLREIADPFSPPHTSVSETSSTPASAESPTNAAQESQQASRVRNDEGRSKEREFYPPPHEICSAVERLYPVTETLIVCFENDTLDDSPQLVEVLQRCDGANHSVVQLTGSHLTPLAQDAPDFAAASATLSGGARKGLFGAIGGVAAEIVGAFGVRDLSKMEVVIDEWIDAGIAGNRF